MVDARERYEVEVVVVAFRLSKKIFQSRYAHPVAASSASHRRSRSSRFVSPGIDRHARLT